MWNKLKTSKKPILLYGTGNACERIMQELNARDINIAGIFASDEFVRGQVFHGYEVMTYQKAKDAFGNMIVLVCFGSHLENVIDNVIRISKEQELYAPDLPVVGEGLFTKSYADNHKDDLLWLSSILADDKSKEVLESLTSYRIDGKLEHLFKVHTSEEENRSLLNLSNDEVYVDLGAYTGDTVESFVSSTNGYKKIYAVEPEDRNFRKLSENTANLKNIELFHAAIGDCCKTVMFTHGVGRGGALGKGKTRPIDQITVDSILNKNPASYIKMDLEGEEIPAIIGCEQTLKEYKPKLEIAAYHRIDDYWTIPRKILEINPSYKVYLRKAPCIPAWEVNFYFI